MIQSYLMLTAQQQTCSVTNKQIIQSEKHKEHTIHKSAYSMFIHFVIFLSLSLLSFRRIRIQFDLIRIEHVLQEGSLEEIMLIEIWLQVFLR